MVKEKIIGILSDSHGPLDPWALKALKAEKVDHIIHAGDIVSASVIDDLKQIAPLTVVRGNMDFPGLPRGIANTEICQVSDFVFYVLHDLQSLDLDPEAAQINVVIHGHTHKAQIEWIDNILYFNPGSVNQPRFAAPASMGFIYIKDKKLIPRIIFND